MMLITEHIDDFNLDQTQEELGIQISPEEAEAIMGCPEEVPQEHESVYRRIKNVIDNSDRQTLKDAFHQIRNLLKKNQSVQMEQAAATLPVMILGVPLSTVALAAIGLLLLTGIIGKLLKRRDKAYLPSCRAGAKEMRKQFGRKLL